MSDKPGTSGKLFGSLGANNINIVMIAQGSDEINITVGVKKKILKNDTSYLRHICHKGETVMKTIAIVGATGAVGQQMLKCLEERNIQCNLKLLASARSKGKNSNSSIKKLFVKN